MLTCYDSGIHELSTGLKVNATRGRLLGGEATLAAIGTALIGFIVDKAKPALSAAASAAWKSLTGQEASDDKGAMEQQLAEIDAKFDKLQEGGQQLVDELKEIKTMLDPASSYPEAVAAPMVETVAEKVTGLDLPNRLDNIEINQHEVSQHAQSIRDISNVSNVGGIQFVAASGVNVGSMQVSNSAPLNPKP